LHVITIGIAVAKLHLCGRDVMNNRGLNGILERADLLFGMLSRRLSRAAGAIGQHERRPMTGTALRKEPIWRPDDKSIENSQMTAFIRYCQAQTGRVFPDYASFHTFSVQDYRGFWRLFLRWSRLFQEGELSPVCTHETCEEARFFPNLRLNYVENLIESGESGMTTAWPSPLSISTASPGG
jgi:hypothetical protein